MVGFDVKDEGEDQGLQVGVEDLPDVGSQVAVGAGGSFDRRAAESFVEQRVSVRFAIGVESDLGGQ